MSLRRSLYGNMAVTVGTFRLRSKSRCCCASAFSFFQSLVTIAAYASDMMSSCWLLADVMAAAESNV